MGFGIILILIAGIGGVGGMSDGMATRKAGLVDSKV